MIQGISKPFMSRVMWSFLDVSSYYNVHPVIIVFRCGSFCFILESVALLTFSVTLFAFCFHRLFERGLAYVGTDYRSNNLWDEYIKYEESLQAWSHLAVIYTRILEHPIMQLDRYFNW